MEYIPLPTAEQTLLEMTPKLSGEVFTFLYDWNGTTDTWSLHISDVTGAPVISGIKLVPAFPLLRHAVSENSPRGEMFILSVNGEDVTRESIARCKLVYVGDSELL